MLWVPGFMVFFIFLFVSCGITHIFHVNVHVYVIKVYSSSLCSNIMAHKFVYIYIYVVCIV